MYMERRLSSSADHQLETALDAYYYSRHIDGIEPRLAMRQAATDNNVTQKALCEAIAGRYGEVIPSMHGGARQGAGRPMGAKDRQPRKRRQGG